MDLHQMEGGFREERVCAHCGKVFVAHGKTAKYCEACKRKGFGGKHFHGNHKPLMKHAEVNARLAERERMARELGMSYGMYMASKKQIGR